MGEVGDVGERAVEEFGRRSGRNLLTGVPDADVGVPIGLDPGLLERPQGHASYPGKTLRDNIRGD
jgi:hypothetical protein